MEFDNLTVAEAGAAAPAATQWVVFVCSEQRYALALERVCEILTPRPFTRLPGSGEQVAGLIGVRSRIITAYDLGRVLGHAAARERPDHRILLVETGGRVLGLVADDVLAVVSLDLADAPPEGNGLVLGRADWDGEPVHVLELDAVLGRALRAAES